MTVKNFTPFICRLEQLDGCQSFAGVKKRQMMNPVDIAFETKYNLKHEQEQIDEEPVYVHPHERSHSYNNVHMRSYVPEAQRRGISVDDLCDDDDYDL